jgi:ribosome-associated protein
MNDHGQKVMVKTFAVRGEYIQLDQLLKATQLATSGGEAHAMVEAGRVAVDGQPEHRKRAKLRAGQRVEVTGEGGEVIELVQGNI